MRYTLIKQNQLNSTITQLLFVPESGNGPFHIAGQYVELSLSDGSCYPYSIANVPDQHGSIELHIRDNPENNVFAVLMSDLASKGVIELSVPMGSSTYPPSSIKPIILLAGGTGFVPMKATIEQALKDGLQQPMHLFWGVRAPEDLYWSEPIAAWCEQEPLLQFTPVVSQPVTNWSGATGLVHEVLLSDYNTLAGYQIYISGPMGLVRNAFELLPQHGARLEHMYSDLEEFL